MIIKSMSRGEPSFAQLLAYINRPNGSWPTLTYNLFSQQDGNDYQAIVEEFEENHTYLAKRKNGNSLYHEVLVLDRQDQISQQRQGEILLDLAEKYIALRASHQLVYGRAHFNTDYPHIHLLVSSNAPRSTQRKRLSKAELRAIQTQIEEYKLERYPELGNELIYNYAERRKEKIRLSTREYEAAKRTGEKVEKERLREFIGKELSAARSQVELDKRLESLGYRLYQRGSTWGVINNETGRRYRLKTIGLDQTLQTVRNRFAQLTERQRDLADLHTDRIEHEANRELIFNPENEQ